MLRSVCACLRACACARILYEHWDAARICRSCCSATCARRTQRMGKRRQARHLCLWLICSAWYAFLSLHTSCRYTCSPLCYSLYLDIFLYLAFVSFWRVSAHFCLSPIFAALIFGCFFLAQDTLICFHSLKPQQLTIEQIFIYLKMPSYFIK